MNWFVLDFLFGKNSIGGLKSPFRGPKGYVTVNDTTTVKQEDGTYIEVPNVTDDEVIVND